MSYDRVAQRLKGHSEVTTIPWVGDQYDDTPTKLLVVCETHYLAKDRTYTDQEIRGFTGTFVRKWLGAPFHPEQERYAFLTKIARFVARTGLVATAVPEEAIQRVAYCNVLQLQRPGWLPVDSRTPITNDEVVVGRSIEALRRIVDATEPELILVMGMSKTRHYLGRYLEAHGEPWRTSPLADYPEQAPSLPEPRRDKRSSASPTHRVVLSTRSN